LPLDPVYHWDRLRPILLEAMNSIQVLQQTGGVVGVFFELAFGGVLPRHVADWCFGPEQSEVQ
jgi:hypothetical protein